MATESKRRAQRVYIENRKRVSFYITEEQYQKLKSATSGSMNAFIMDAICEKLERTPVPRYVCKKCGKPAYLVNTGGSKVICCAECGNGAGRG